MQNLILTKTGLAYTGRSTTALNTKMQWAGCLGAFGKNPKVGASATLAAVLASYKAGNPNNSGGGLANIKYHVRNGRLTAKG